MTFFVSSSPTLFPTFIIFIYTFILSSTSSLSLLIVLPIVIYLLLSNFPLSFSKISSSSIYNLFLSHFFHFSLVSPFLSLSVTLLNLFVRSNGITTMKTEEVLRVKLFKYFPLERPQIALKQGSTVLCFTK